MLVVIVLLICSNFALNIRRRWNRNRCNRQLQVVPVQYRSTSAPPTVPTVRIEDVLAQPAFIRENSIDPPILSRHGTPAPEPNILINPPAMNREGSVQPVYDDQIAIINRINPDNAQDDHEEEQQQQQDQRSLMNAILNCDVQNTFQQSSFELITFDENENITTLDSQDNCDTIL